LKIGGDFGMALE